MAAAGETTAASRLDIECCRLGMHQQDPLDTYDNARDMQRYRDTPTCMRQCMWGVMQLCEYAHSGVMQPGTDGIARGVDGKPAHDDPACMC